MSRPLHHLNLKLHTYSSSPHHIYQHYLAPSWILSLSRLFIYQLPYSDPISQHASHERKRIQPHPTYYALITSTKSKLIVSPYKINSRRAERRPEGNDQCHKNDTRAISEQPKSIWQEQRYACSFPYQRTTCSRSLPYFVQQSFNKLLLSTLMLSLLARMRIISAKAPHYISDASNIAMISGSWAKILAPRKIPNSRSLLHSECEWFTFTFGNHSPTLGYKRPHLPTIFHLSFIILIPATSFLLPGLMSLFPVSCSLPKVTIITISARPFSLLTLLFSHHHISLLNNVSFSSCCACARQKHCWWWSQGPENATDSPSQFDLNRIHCSDAHCAMVCNKIDKGIMNVRSIAQKNNAEWSALDADISLADQNPQKRMESERRVVGE